MSIKRNKIQNCIVISANKPIFIQMLQTPCVRRALLVGCSLQMFQQLSGINTVMYVYTYVFLGEKIVIKKSEIDNNNIATYNFSNHKIMKMFAYSYTAPSI